MKVQGWRAYYADGSAYDSDSHEWESLPKNGILGVVVFHEPPYRTLVRGDWIYMQDGEIKSVPEEARGEWADPPDVPLEDLKRGVEVSDMRWATVERHMMEDKKWP